MGELDPHAIVEGGYDSVADPYAGLEREDRAWPRLRWLDRLVADLPAGARVFDVGCGNGVPATRRLAERLDATGVDVSAAQIERARRNVPAATFMHASLMDCELPAPFAAIAAFYVVDHLPRERHAEAFARFHRCLEPGGRLLFTIEPHDEAGMVATWPARSLAGGIAHRRERRTASRTPIGSRPCHSHSATSRTTSRTSAPGSTARPISSSAWRPGRSSSSDPG